MTASTMLTLEAARKLCSWVTDADFRKLVGIARKYGMQPVDLALVIFHESGFRTTATNGSSLATGLLQWMPGNVPGGLTRAQLLQLSFSEQLDLVDRWLARWSKPRGGRPWTSAGLVYCTVFAPARISPTADESTVCYPAGHPAVAANPSLHKSRDGNGDPQITIGDLTSTLRVDLPTARFAPFLVRTLAASSSSGAAVFGIVVALGAAVAAGVAAAHLWR